MTTSSTKWFTIGAFGLSTIFAYFGGFAGSTFIERQLETDSVAPEIVAVTDTPSTTESSSGRKPTTKNRSVSESQYVQSIVNRSIFDSSQAGKKSSALSDAIEGDSVQSSLQLTLMATIIATPTQYSVALIQDESESSNTYGVGYDLIGQATITKIEKNRVYFQRNNSDQIEYIEIGGEEAKSDAPKAAKKGDAGNDGDVQKVGNNKYVIEQAILDEILSNPEKLYTQVRVTPHKDQDGNIDGYRMTGIRRKSLFYKLGIKNGDIVHNVNGQPLNSLSSAMDAYNSLGNSRDFNFDVTRRKNKQTFEYEVR
jgi:type II secretion system protein C